MMARRIRIVIPKLPHHITQWDNRREPIFFEDGDHEVYRDLLAEQSQRATIRRLIPLIRSKQALAKNICGTYTATGCP